MGPEGSFFVGFSMLDVLFFRPSDSQPPGASDDVISSRLPTILATHHSPFHLNPFTFLSFNDPSFLEFFSRYNLQAPNPLIPLS